MFVDLSATEQLHLLDQIHIHNSLDVQINVVYKQWLSTKQF